MAEKGPQPNANHDGRLCFSSWPQKWPAGAKGAKERTRTFLKALNKVGIKIEENKGAKTIVFYEAKLP